MEINEIKVWMNYAIPDLLKLNTVPDGAVPYIRFTQLAARLLDFLGFRNRNFQVLVWMKGFESCCALPHNEEGLMVNKWLWRPQEPLTVASFFTTAVDYARFFCATLATEQSPYSDDNRLPARYLESMLQPPN